jgi:hypothetical protein
MAEKGLAKSWNLTWDPQPSYQIISANEATVLLYFLGREQPVKQKDYTGG